MPTLPGHKLSLVARLSYGVGHVLNDLSASMWFSYLLVYLHQVRYFNNKLAGNLMLIGQISDALATPFIGYESDKSKGFCRMGKRKSWHFIGTLCVIASFPFLFIGCITCNYAPDWSQLIYYIPFVVIFQFGWASTQISHLSLIPDLTPCENERVGLNGLRYAFTVLSNLSVYGIAWALFALGSETGGVDTEQLGVGDAPQFRNLAFIVVGIGVVFSFIFHVGTREPRQHDSDDVITGRDAVRDSEKVINQKPKAEKMNIRNWFKEPQFYLIAVLYMSTRLYVNLSQVYLPMYLIETLQLHKTNIAIIPLIVYASGFPTSMVMKPVNKLAGRKVTYIIGVAFAIASCVWLHLMTKDNCFWMVVGAAILMGIGGSTMLVTSLALVSDLIGNNSESGAFVFGAMSFTDKLSNGVGVMIIQTFHPCVNCCPACLPYYRWVQSVIPGSCALVGAIMILTLIPQNIGKRRRDRHKELLPCANGVTPAMYDEEPDERAPLISNITRRTPIDVRVHTSMNTPPADVEEIMS